MYTQHIPAIYHFSIYLCHKEFLNYYVIVQNVLTCLLLYLKNAATAVKQAYLMSK